jgi:glutamate 5-kinase
MNETPDRPDLPARAAPPGRTRRLLVSGALVASGLLAGGVLAGAHIAGAATNSGSTSTATAAATQNGTRPDPAKVAHGPGETLLTGTTAAKVKAAALAAVPGGTVIRVETDSEGSPYEAHIRKADGTYVTVKVDSSFKVTSTIGGFGMGPHGAPGQGSSGA